jgi:hypothetical protein
MKYLAQDFARCMSNPLLDQCKQCQRNVNINPVSPDAQRQSWIGPWVGHGPCPNGDYIKEVEDE